VSPLNSCSPRGHSPNAAGRGSLLWSVLLCSRDRPSQYTAMAVCYLRPTTPPVARYQLYWLAAVQFFPRGVLFREIEHLCSLFSGALYPLLWPLLWGSIASFASVPPTGLWPLFFNTLGSGNQYSGLSTGLWASVFQSSYPAHGTGNQYSGLSTGLWASGFQSSFFWNSILCTLHRPLGLWFSILFLLEFNTLAYPPASGPLFFNPLIPPTGLEFNTLAYPPASGPLFFNPLGSGIQYSGLSTGLWASVSHRPLDLTNLCISPASSLTSVSHRLAH
jgi:hypothetical protein